MVLEGVPEAVAKRCAEREADARRRAPGGGAPNQAWLPGLRAWQQAVAGMLLAALAGARLGPCGHRQPCACGHPALFFALAHMSMGLHAPQCMSSSALRG